MDRKIVILFEDNAAIGKRIEDAIRENLPAGVELIRFIPKLPSNGTAYEDRILQELRTPDYAGATLIVSDRDLSATADFGGLSEAVVSKVANRLAIPVALYATGYTDALLERQRQFGDARIVLDPECIGPVVATLVSGFSKVSSELRKVLDEGGGQRLRSPAAVMAHLLGKPELSDLVSLYGAGDQKMLAEVLPFAVKGKRLELEERLPCLLGYWLFDSILRYPGILVNSVAAASYLNISVSDYSKDEVRAKFSDALYLGPFSSNSDPLWWRHLLDEIIQESGVVDGKSVVDRAGLSVSSCSCSVDPNRPAGWYCVATRMPVSLEESEGNISWFPPGADLARIRKDVFDELGPWLGLY
jgi:hypothetical protein